MTHWRRFKAVPILAVALLSAACGGSGSEAADGPGPERTDLVVGTLPVPDGSPLFIAIQKGFFKQEGLNVKHEIIPTGAASGPKLVAGTMDFTLANYVSAFTSSEKGALKWRFVADSYRSAPNTFLLLAPKESPIKKTADLKGKTIAVVALKSINTLAIASTLNAQGLKESDVKFREIPFPQMGAALKAGQVDAAFATEPAITTIQSSLGAVEVADTMSGATDSFPIAGWATLEQYVAKYPKTVAAFQRAMGKAQRLAAGDRKEVERVLPSYTQIKPETASVITLGTFPTSLNAITLQRVPDLLRQYGYMKKPVDAKSMLVSETPK